MNKIKTRAKAASRGDGIETRQRIIDCAGRLIAKNGFAKTTSKSICAAAKVNMAAVNYHFGSREGLYIAIMQQVHTYMLNFLQVNDLYTSSLSPKEKIESFLDMYINNVLFGDNWYLEVWIREEMSASPFLEELLKEQAKPKIDLLVKIFAEYLSLPPDDPRLYSYVASAISPFMMMFIGRHSHAHKLLPKAYAVLPEVIDSMKAFVFAGLEIYKNTAAKTSN